MLLFKTSFFYETYYCYKNQCFSYRDLLDIRKTAEKTLKDTTEWKKEQTERDVIINKKISMQAEHIK